MQNRFVNNLESAKANAKQLVAVTGIARDAKIGAAVVVNDLVVYCSGVDSWPAELAGREVTAQGVLEQTAEFASGTGPDGAVSAGTSGPVWVLRNCTFKR